MSVWREFVVRGSKQEVTEVVPLAKVAEKHNGVSTIFN